MHAKSPEYTEKLRRAAQERESFVAAFGVRKIKWSSHNLSYMLRLTGEPRERIAEMRTILGHLGLGDRGAGYYGWLQTNGVFDHGEMWGRDRKPLLIVGHPYGISDEEHRFLEELRRFPCLSVGVDDRPSYYGFGTNHVRIGLATAVGLEAHP